MIENCPPVCLSFCLILRAIEYVVKVDAKQFEKLQGFVIKMEVTNPFET